MKIGFMILDFLNEYKKNHTKEEVMELIQDIINQEKIKYLPKRLKQIDKKVLSRELSQIVLNDIRNNILNKDDLIPLLSDIVKQEIKPEKKRYKLKRVAVVGAISTMMVSSVICFGKTKTTAPVKAITNLEINEPKLAHASDYQLIKKQNDRKHQGEDAQKAKDEQDDQKQLEKHQKHEEKQRVLNDYRKFKTVGDIIKRQKELEKLDLTEKDKLYKDCKLKPALQQFIYELSILYHLPPDFTFSIIATESRGSFNSSGTASYNKNQNDHDLGLSQQNSTYSVTRFCQKFNIDYEKACKLVKNNDYMNMVSTFLEYQEIMGRLPSYDPEEYAGYYNGWTEWEEKEISVKYVNIFKDYYNNEFTKYHKIKTKK